MLTHGEFLYEEGDDFPFLHGIGFHSLDEEFVAFLAKGHYDHSKKQK
jgi:hypothetical protein